MAITFLKPKAETSSADNHPMIDIRSVNKFYKTAIGDYHALMDKSIKHRTNGGIAIASEKSIFENA